MPVFAMLVRRAALSAAPRPSRIYSPLLLVRGFMAPTISRRADFVQELYLKELKVYKMPAVKDSDAKGHVYAFSVPEAPPSPEEPDLAGSLKEYQAILVEVEGQDASGAAPSTRTAVDDFLEHDEIDPNAEEEGGGH